MTRNKSEEGRLITPEEVNKETAEQPDEMAELLQAAAGALSKAATDRENRGAALKEVEASLSKIRLIDFPDLAESPVVQAFIKAMGMDDLKPGEVRNKGTLAEREREWTLKDLAAMDHVTIIPAISEDFTWNGVGPFRLVAGEEVTVPKVVEAEYKRVMEARRQANINEKYMFGMSDIAPHPNWQTAEGAAVRAWSIQGRPHGRPGGSISVGPLPRGEEDAGA